VVTALIAARSWKFTSLRNLAALGARMLPSALAARFTEIIRHPAKRLLANGYSTPNYLTDFVLISRRSCLRRMKTE
jgi:hypothetical protein